MNLLCLRIQIAAITLIGIEVAFADSDGYYCVGTDYVAYQFHQPGLPDAHRLFVVPFNGGGTKIVRHEAILSDFQVHDMRCADKHVQLVGWDSAHDVTWTAYDPTPLKVESIAKEPGAPEYGDDGLPRNMIWGGDQRVSLYDPDSSVSYGLETTTERIPEPDCKVLVTVRLWKHNADVVVDSVILVSREMPQECGE